MAGLNISFQGILELPGHLVASDNQLRLTEPSGFGIGNGGWPAAAHVGLLPCKRN